MVTTDFVSFIISYEMVPSRATDSFSNIDNDLVLAIFFKIDSQAMSRICCILEKFSVEEVEEVGVILPAGTNNAKVTVSCAVAYTVDRSISTGVASCTVPIVAIVACIVITYPGYISAINQFGLNSQLVNVRGQRISRNNRSIPVEFPFK